MVKPNLRTKSIGTKVTEEEFARLEQAAQKASKTLGEWCREVMLGRSAQSLDVLPGLTQPTRLFSWSVMIHGPGGLP